jgi:hypothetical protein
VRLYTLVESKASSGLVEVSLQGSNSSKVALFCFTFPFTNRKAWVAGPRVQSSLPARGQPCSITFVSGPALQMR